jgi:hypothetical protein
MIAPFDPFASFATAAGNFDCINASSNSFEREDDS